jgi:O-antigen ligase
MGRIFARLRPQEIKTIMTDNSKQSLVVGVPVFILLVSFFAIPFSPTLNALIMVVGLWCIVNSQLRHKLKNMINQPAFWWGLGFFIWIVIRSFGGYPESASVKFKFFLHYFNLFLPVFLLPPLFEYSKNRLAVMIAVMISAGVFAIVLLLSTLYHTHHYTGLLPAYKYVLHIETLQISVFLAVAAYLSLMLCYRSRQVWYYCALCMFNFVWLTIALVFFQHERIGLLLYFIGVLLFLFQHFSLKRALIIAVLAIGTVVLMLSVHHSFLSRRIVVGVKQIESFQKDKTNVMAINHSSVGTRLFFYQIGFKQWKHSPIIGYGSGTYSHHQGGNSAYFILHMSGHNGTAENHYLTIALQLGLIGLILFLGYMVQLWRMSILVPLFEAHMIRTLITFLLVSGIFFPAFTFNIVTITFAGLLGVSFGALQVSQDDNDKK